MFIMLYCCLLVRVQPLSLAWADLHHTNSLWALFQGPSLSFGLATLYSIWGHQKFSPKQQWFSILQLIPKISGMCWWDKDHISNLVYTWKVKMKWEESIKEKEHPEVRESEWRKKKTVRTRIRLVTILKRNIF